MDERFMTRVEKYEADWEKKNTAADFHETAGTQLEEAAYARSLDRQRDREAGAELKRYDPWGTGTERDPHLHCAISGAQDFGLASDIPAPEAKPGQLLENPYFDPTAERHKYVTFDAGTAAEYQDKWLEQEQDQPRAKQDHRKAIVLGDLTSPTAAVSQAEMVRVRFKEQAAGMHDTHEAHHKSHYLEGLHHFHDTGVESTLPPVVNGGVVDHPQHSRSKHNDFEGSGRDVYAKQHPEIPFAEGPKPEAKGMSNTFKDEAQSLNSHELRNMPFAKGRPSQYWN